MKVKILKCSVPTYWYHDCIGLSFEVIKKDYSYELLECPEDQRMIEIEDCKIIDEEQKEEPFLTEEQFSVIDTFCRNHILSGTGWKNRLNEAKEKGWIKKSKKQDLIDWYLDIKGAARTQEGMLYSEKQFDELYQKAIAAIEEAENK